MANEHRIRIRLKAYDHEVVDESARKIAETVIRTQAKVKGPVPVPVIKAGPCPVVQIKRLESDGYGAIQIAYRELPANKVNKPTAGHFARAGVTPHRHLVEVRVDDPDAYTLGQEISIADVLTKGGLADAAGVSRGKGFQGVMKRHNFQGQGAS